MKDGMPPLRVSVSLGVGFDVWLHCYFLTGLVQLSREGVISLRTMRAGGARGGVNPRGADYPLFTVTCSDARSGTTRRICFDARDQSDVWQMNALEEADVYFKRSFHLPDVEKLPPGIRGKVRAINPMFATWPRRAPEWKARVGISFVTTAARKILTGEGAASALKTLSAHVRLLLSLSSVDRYEGTPPEPKRPQVLFQTRLWDPASEKGDWVGACNQERIEMVRTLRAGLGNAFVGGLSSTPYAATRYPELLSNLTVGARSRRPEFIALCREFLVRVNIRALFEAVPYSLGETLAANNALVSHPLRNTCVPPLIGGRHYAGFTTAKECVDQCRALLDSEARARRLREEAHTFYAESVRPREAMRAYLHQAMLPTRGERPLRPPKEGSPIVSDARNVTRW
jgi:hypothetical protein